MSQADRLYLDYAATTPMLPAARAAMADAMTRWANPSSPHAEGRAARAVLEDTRARIKAVLGWAGTVVFTSGASEAIGLVARCAKLPGRVVSPTEHDAVHRAAKRAARLGVDENGVVQPTEITAQNALHFIQHVNNETGVIQPIAALAEAVHGTGGLLACDCAQSAGKIDLPEGADFYIVSAHKFGGPPGIGALLVRDLATLEADGGQEQGYRGGTENVPAVVGMAMALEAPRNWMAGAAELRTRLDAAIIAVGGEVVAKDAPRIPTIASYRMPGVAARAQLIRFDMAGIAISAGAACSSGTLKTSPVLGAMGWEASAADEVIRVSIGPETREADIDRFLAEWQKMAQSKP